ncbi:MAG: 16S rRNA (cytidine(1402)-2'-O)-methyltransferase [Gemmatimonadetes bacterium]|nr:16S rRNA (cytidine(1402)-2'-O)-methyltransferase [Gemmatimonadota bacterium]NNM04043.1 16S rRNA (cytidine(1402)-2'-O)-methyltransferase [Gemmatimonadota bacterium]
MAKLFLVSTPIGNLGDLSPRAGEALASVSRILAEDTRRTRKLLSHLGLAVPLVSLHSHNEASRLKMVVDSLASGEDLALVSDAGTPLVSDPGRRVVEAVLDAGFPVVPIPGPSAVLAALVGSGFSGDRFSFLGFLPRKGPERAELLDRIYGSPDTVVLFESPERVADLLTALSESCGPDRAVAVARELTKVHEEFVRGSLAQVGAHFQDNRPRGEFVVVVSGSSEAERGTAVDEEAARALAVALLKDGLTPSRAAREVARRLKVPRNLSYDIVQDVSRGDGSRAE